MTTTVQPLVSTLPNGMEIKTDGQYYANEISLATDHRQHVRWALTIMRDAGTMSAMPRPPR